jgi:hypothetical protein
VASDAAASRARAEEARLRERPRGPERPAEPADAVLTLQRGAGNAAVSRLLARTADVRPPPRRTVARAESLVQQGALAIAGGGVTVSLAAYQKQGVAIQNSLAHVGEKDKRGGPLGAHLGPVDALRHCSWSALVMMAALVDTSPEHRLLDTVSGLALPRPPPLIDFLSVSPAAGTQLFPEARERTRAVLLAHEIAGTGTGTADSRMDQRNNEAGMDVAEALFKQRKTSDEAVCAAARAAFDEGRLVMFDIEGGLVSTAGWRELNPDTWLWGEYLDVTANPTAKQPRPRTRAERDKAAAPPAPTP